MNKYFFLLFGTAFGFILSRAGATTYDYYAQLFLFENLQLLWVITFAVMVGAVSTSILKAIKVKSSATGKPLEFTGKPYSRKLIPGSLIFGLGWGLAGACPGTVLAMLGEGKLGATFTIFGITLGTYLYGLQQSRSKSKVKLKDSTTLAEA